MITGSKIRMARQLRKISSKEIASKLDMEESSYSRLERGETKLTEDRVQKILQLLDVTREFIEQLEDHMNFNNTYTDNTNGNFVNTHYADFSNNDHMKHLQKTLDLIQLQIENQNKLIESVVKLLDRTTNPK